MFTRIDFRSTDVKHELRAEHLELKQDHRTCCTDDIANFFVKDSHDKHVFHKFSIPTTTPNNNARSTSQTTTHNKMEFKQATSENKYVTYQLTTI